MLSTADLTDLLGDLTDSLGDLSNLLGDLSNLRGDLSVLRGDLSVLLGDLFGELFRTISLPPSGGSSSSFSSEDSSSELDDSSDSSFLVFLPSFSQVAFATVFLTALMLASGCSYVPFCSSQLQERLLHDLMLLYLFLLLALHISVEFLLPSPTTVVFSLIDLHFSV